jgi:hypothetical protein
VFCGTLRRHFGQEFNSDAFDLVERLTRDAGVGGSNVCAGRRTMEHLDASNKFGDGSSMFSAEFDRAAKVYFTSLVLLRPQELLPVESGNEWDNSVDIQIASFQTNQ